MTRVRIAALPWELRPIRDFSELTDQIDFFLDMAVDYHVDFALLPEYFSMQLLSMLAVRDPEEAVRRLAEFAPRIDEHFLRRADEHRMWIVGGSTPRVRGGAVYNVASLYGPGGRHFMQDKLHLTPTERDYWKMTPGEEVRVFETPKAVVGLTICYDVEFPELCRMLADAGAMLLFVPFATDDRRGYLRVRYSALARAVENQLYVATAGNMGNLPRVQYMFSNYGGAGIYTPSDVPFARDGIASESFPNQETMIFADVDLASLDEARRSGAVRNFRDRRPELYTRPVERQG